MQKQIVRREGDNRPTLTVDNALLQAGLDAARGQAIELADRRKLPIKQGGALHDLHQGGDVGSWYFRHGCRWSQSMSLVCPNSDLIREREQGRRPVCRLCSCYRNEGRVPCRARLWLWRMDVS